MGVSCIANGMMGGAEELPFSEGNEPWRSGSDGVVGALLPRGSLEGFSMNDRSWLEMASERRCAWPRRLVRGAVIEAEGGGSVSPPFVGLELMNPIPDLPSPPMNSLPFLRCPLECVGVGFEGEPVELLSFSGGALALEE